MFSPALKRKAEMSPKELRDLVASSKYISCREGPNDTIQLCWVNGLTRGFEFSVDALKAANLKDVEAMLDGKRGASAMMHVSRIVGYSSFHHNWSGSKLAELADRHKGNYTVTDGSIDLSPPGKAH